MRKYLVLFILLALNPLFGSDSYEKLFKEGKLSILKSKLEDDQKKSADYYFYKNLIEENLEEQITGFKKFIEKFDDSSLYDNALMELGKIYFTKRNFSISYFYFDKVSKDEILKFFWLSRACFNLNEFTKSIKNAQKYITLSNDDDKIILSYLNIAESFRYMKKYEEAITTLLSLQKSNYSQKYRAFIEYQIGFLYFENGEIDNSISYLKNIIRSYPDSESRYLAENLLYNMNSKKIIGTEEIISASLIKDSPETNKKEISNIDLDKCFELQAGAFSAKRNANRRKKEILRLGYKAKICNKRSQAKNLFAVIVGPFTEQKANLAQKKLSEKKINTFIQKR